MTSSGSNNIAGIIGGSEATAILSNCFNTGIINNQTTSNSNAIAGSYSSMTNCYYEMESCSVTCPAIPKSESDFANGSVLALIDPAGEYFMAGPAGKPILKDVVNNWGSYTDENNLRFNLKTNETATLVNGSAFEGDLEVPAEIEYEGKTYTVTAIGESAFKNNENLFSVYIPSSVTYVGNSAFSGCPTLTDVNCEDGASLLQFGSDVFSGSPFVYLYMGRDFKAVTPSAGPFYNSTSLADVEFGRDVTYIPDYGFYGCSGINEIKLLDGMKYVGANAFQGCTSLTDLIVGKNVAFLGANSFAGCTSLQGVEVNATDADFMANAFNGDRSIATVNTPSVNDWLGIRFYNGTANPLAYAAALTVDSKSIASVTVPASFHKVSDFAFYNAGNIESVTFRNGVDTIGESAFYNCMNLESVSIPASIKLIDKNAFYGSSLSEVTIPENAGDYDIMSSAFRRIKTLSAAKLGGSLKVLGGNAFQGDDNLEKVELAGTVKSIGLSAFADDVKLSDFTIADGADTVAFAATVFTGAPLATLYLGKSFTQPSSSSSTDNPFYNKTSVKTLTFGGPVKLIPAYSFRSCTGIDSLGFAEGTADVSMTIGNYAFEGCSAIKRVAFPGKLTSLGSYAFQNTTSLEEVAFNYGPQSAYIYDYNFYNDRKIANVTIGKSVTLQSTNSNYAPFYGKTSIKNVTLRGAVTAIPTNLFYGCTGIQNLTIESGVASIGNYAFRGCPNIASLNIPNTVTNIGEEAFSYCSGVKELAFEAGNDGAGMNIGANAFYQLNQIQALELPARTKNIRNYAFNYASNLAQVTFANANSDSTLYIWDNVFSDCSKLEKVVLGRNIVFNGTYSPYYGSSYTQTNSNYLNRRYQYMPFYNLPIKEVVVTDSVTSITDDLFRYCTSLQKVTFEDGKKTLALGDRVFNDDSNISEVHLGRSIAYDGYYKTSNTNYMPFYGKTTIKTLTVGQEVKSIPEALFRGCTGVEELSLPVGVQTVGNNAFYGCTGLKSITLEEGKGSTSFGSNALYNAPIEDVVMGHNFTGTTMTTAEAPFYDKTTIKNVSIGSEVTAVPTYAFRGCSGITGIVIPDNVTTIGSYAFYDCSGMTEMSLPAEIKTLPAYAFFGCSGLEKIVIPATVTSIGSAAFSGCTGLDSIYCYVQNAFRITTSVFANVDKNACVLMVPEGKASTYAKTTYWSQFYNIEEMLPPYILIITAEGAEEKIFIRGNNDVVTLEDGVAGIQIAKQYDVKNFEYVRNFTSDKWTSLYVPFSMSYEDWADVAEVAYINAMHQYDDDEDGAIDRTELEIVKIKRGKLLPNHPYLIRPLKAGEVTIALSDVKLERTEANGIDCSSTVAKYNFTGTYDKIEGSTMIANDYYCMGGGNLITLASPSDCLKAMRWYLGIESRSSQFDASPVYIGTIRVKVLGEDDAVEDVETAISEIASVESGLKLRVEDHNLVIMGVEGKTYNVLNLNGKLVRRVVAEAGETVVEGLPAGIYMVEGRKVMVK